MSSTIGCSSPGDAMDTAAPAKVIERIRRYREGHLAAPPRNDAVPDNNLATPSSIDITGHVSRGAGPRDPTR